jgi:hypothetical protein
VETIEFIPAGNSKRYTIDGSLYERVTSLVSEGLPKPYLVPWAAKVAAETAVYEQDSWTELDMEDAVRHIKSTHTRIRDDAGSRGTAIHKVAEAHILEQPLDPEVEAELDEWPDAHRMADYARHVVDHVLTRDMWEDTELACYSETLGYAGTFDGIIRLGPGRVVDGQPDVAAQLLLSLGLDPMTQHRMLVDWKTSKNLGAGFALQLSAYRFAEWFIHTDDEGNAWRVPNDPSTLSDVGLLLSVRPNKWAIHPVPITADVFAAFRDAAGIARWARGRDRAVRKVPLVSGH